MSFTDNGVTATGGSGSGLALDITTNRLGAVTAVNVNSNGQNYTGSDTVTVNGVHLAEEFPELIISLSRLGTHPQRCRE